MQNLYIMRDKVANTTVGIIIRYNAHGPAIRSFFDALKLEGGPYAQHVEDYQLLHIGTIDEDTGIISANEHGLRHIVADGNELTTKEKA